MKKTMKKKAKIVKKVKKATKKVGPKSDFGIKPLADRILLKPISAEELNTTSSGIIIPDTVSKEKPEQGIVIAVGDGKWDDGVKMPLSVRVGDRVVFSRYGYDEIKYNGEGYYILKEENILAVIKN